MEWLAKIESQLLPALRGVQIGLLGPVILAAAFGVYLLGGQVQKLVVAVQAASATQHPTKTAQAVVEKKPLTGPEVLRYQEILRRLHPAITIEPSAESGGLVFSIGDPRLYNEWMFALYSLQSYGKNVLWDATRVCLKECSGVAATAVVQGYVQSVRFK